MKNVCFIRTPTVSGERQFLRNTSKMAESSLVMIAMVTLGSCDPAWQPPRMGRTLEMLGMDSYSSTPGTAGEKSGGTSSQTCMYMDHQVIRGHQTIHDGASRASNRWTCGRT